MGTSDHLVPASGLERLIERHTEVELIEAMAIPLHVAAVDVITGQELRLSRGPVLDAVLGSAAIPGVLPPVRWDDLTSSSCAACGIPQPRPVRRSAAAPRNGGAGRNG